MKLTYKLIRKKWKVRHDAFGHKVQTLVTETGATGLTKEQAEKQARGTTWTPVRETIAAPTTAQEVAAAPLVGSRVTA